MSNASYEIENEAGIPRVRVQGMEGRLQPQFEGWLELDLHEFELSNQVDFDRYAISEGKEPGRYRSIAGKASGCRVNDKLRIAGTEIESTTLQLSIVQGSRNSVYIQYSYRGDHETGLREGWSVQIALPEREFLHVWEAATQNDVNGIVIWIQNMMPEEQKLAISPEQALYTDSGVMPFSSWSGDPWYLLPQNSDFVTAKAHCGRVTVSFNNTEVDESVPDELQSEHEQSVERLLGRTAQYDQIEGVLKHIERIDRQLESGFHNRGVFLNWALVALLVIQVANLFV